MVIGIMVLNRNGRRWLEPLLETIAAQRYRALRVYLVDNASSDDSVPLFLSVVPTATVVQLPENLGFSMAYNTAIPFAFADGCDWVILANNDILLDAACVGALVEAASCSDDVGILGPAFFSWDGDEPNYYMRGKHPNCIPALLEISNAPIDVDWVEGSFLMVSRRCFEDVGPLEPMFFFYWEDADYCRRARYKRWRVMLVPAAVARHYAAGSSIGPERAQFDRLKRRNYYVYQMTDPARSFARNLGSGARLFITRLKATVFGTEASMAREFAAVFSLIGDAKQIRRKWLRDRAAGRPESVSPAYAGLPVEIIRGDSRDPRRLT